MVHPLSPVLVNLHACAAPLVPQEQQYKVVGVALAELPYRKDLRVSKIPNFPGGMPPAPLREVAIRSSYKFDPQK